jgi:hypothetical protein
MQRKRQKVPKLREKSASTLTSRQTEQFFDGKSALWTLKKEKEKRRKGENEKGETSADASPLKLYLIKKSYFARDLRTVSARFFARAFFADWRLRFFILIALLLRPRPM